MATAKENALCVRWFLETKSETQVQRTFHTHFGTKPPTPSSIRSCKIKS